LVYNRKHNKPRYDQFALQKISRVRRVWRCMSVISAWGRSIMSLRVALVI
jgi:hypothetical protein